MASLDTLQNLEGKRPQAKPGQCAEPWERKTYTYHVQSSCCYSAAPPKRILTQTGILDSPTHREKRGCQKQRRQDTWATFQGPALTLRITRSAPGRSVAVECRLTGGRTGRLLQRPGRTSWTTWPGWTRAAYKVHIDGLHWDLFSIFSFLGLRWTCPWSPPLNPKHVSSMLCPWAPPKGALTSFHKWCALKLFFCIRFKFSPNLVANCTHISPITLCYLGVFNSIHLVPGCLS